MLKFLLLTGLAWVLAPVHLQTLWGSQKSGSIDSLTARAILDSPLQVRDEQGNSYTITRFRFSYRQKSEFQDSAGKTITDFRLFSKEFYDATVIDTLWRNTIAPELQSGETFYMDHIVVKSADGKKLLAPDLQIDIQ
jgi:hypothetical protein